MIGQHHLEGGWLVNISELPIGTKIYTQLGSRVLAVLSRRVDGWCVYVGAVPGQNHDREWPIVAQEGDKQNEQVARAIAASLFHPSLDPGDLPYAR